VRNQSFADTQRTTTITTLQTSRFFPPLHCASSGRSEPMRWRLKRGSCLAALVVVAVVLWLLSVSAVTVAPLAWLGKDTAQSGDEMICMHACLKLTRALSFPHNSGTHQGSWRMDAESRDWLGPGQTASHFVRLDQVSDRPDTRNGCHGQRDLGDPV
jgi:hypothetical protein